VSKKQLPSETAAPASFEEALTELEKIVHHLEGGEVGLNDALTSYEQGVKLLRHCYQLLENAERKIELLSGVDAEGNPISAPFDDTALSLDQKAERRSRRRSAAQPESPPNRGDSPDDTDTEVPGGLF
jgi:exodeoxyribonuclease VII small subunit